MRDITTLLRSWTAELACGATHQDPAIHDPPVNNGQWERHVAADVAHRQQTSIDRSVNEDK
jgi:hypothetical protein